MEIAPYTPSLVLASKAGSAGIAVLMWFAVILERVFSRDLIQSSEAFFYLCFWLTKRLLRQVRNK